MKNNQCYGKVAKKKTFWKENVQLMNINHILNLGNKVNKFSLIIDQKNVEQKKKMKTPRHK